MKLILALIVAVGLTACGKSEPSKAVADALKGKPEAQKVETWDYKVLTDKMDGTKQDAAFLPSNNLVPLKFPYNPGSVATVALYKGKDLKAIDIIVSKGQLSCYSSGCQIRVKFDDQPAITVSAFDASTPGKSNRIQINTAYGDIKFNTFVNKLAAANKVMIEVPFYGEGSQVFEFNPKGLTF